MDPRTATLANSVWRPVTDDLFQRHIAMLWKITNGRPKDPKMYTLPALKASTEEVLPLEVELSLARCFAFTSACGVSSEYVSAAAVETPIDVEDGLVLNIACNRGARPIVREKLDEVVRQMRNIAAEGRDKLKDQCEDRVLDTILELNRARIKARLQSRKHSRDIVLRGLQNILQDIKQRPQTTQLDMLATRLQSLCQSMHQYHQISKQSQNISHTKKLAVACYEFCSATQGENIKSMLIHAGVDVDGPRGNPHIRQIGKIAAYHHVAENLVAIASRRAYRPLCLNMSTRYVQAYNPVQSKIASDTAGGNGLCPVHAKVQLIVDFDTRIPSRCRKLRTIGSSKVACFLCELFVTLHGAYFVSETHGKLTPYWTIPDLCEFTTPQVDQYRNIIGAMDQELLRLATVSHPKRLDPAMSWQALSQLNLLPASPARSTNHACTVSLVQCNSPPVQSVFDAIGNRSFSSLRQTDSFNVVPKIGHSTECSGKTREDLPVRRKVEVLQAIDLDCKNGCDQENPPDLSFNSNMQTAEQNATMDSKTTKNRLPDGEESVQAQPSMNLDNQRRDEVVGTIRGHESRTSNMPSECETSNIQQLVELNIAYSDGISRKIDFHDLKLFFEIEYPATAQISVFPCSNPEAATKEPIVYVDKLNAENEVNLDVGGSLEKYGTMFLCKRRHSGTEVWLKIVMRISV